MKIYLSPSSIHGEIKQCIFSLFQFFCSIGFQTIKLKDRAQSITAGQNQKNKTLSEIESIEKLSQHWHVHPGSFCAKAVA